jgi:predicted Zn-ribbon and HTH transcriptional regulator
VSKPPRKVDVMRAAMRGREPLTMAELAALVSIHPGQVKDSLMRLTKSGEVTRTTIETVGEYARSSHAHLYQLAKVEPLRCIDCGKELPERARERNGKRCLRCSSKARWTPEAKALASAVGKAIRPSVVEKQLRPTKFCRHCEGLPWRRGTGEVGSLCRGCQQPCEHEPPLRLEDFLASRDPVTVLESQTMGRVA